MTLVYKKSEHLPACEPEVGQKIVKILGNNRINRQYTYIKRRVSIANDHRRSAAACPHPSRGRASGEVDGSPSSRDWT
jgi:hypothetical protein